MTELNELFEQIFHSERNFKARLDKLRELTSSIQQCQLELQQTRDEINTKQGELAVKNSKLANIEVEVKVLKLRKEILQQQKNTLAKSKKQLSQQLDVTLNERETQRQSFMEEMSEFSKHFDLCGTGRKLREEETKKKVAVLQDELLLLDTEMAELISQKEDVEALKTELINAECELRAEKDRGEELKRLKAEQDSHIQQLKQDNTKPSKDPEFVRLQQELESCKECPEEHICKNLSKQLEELQRQCYHMQMRQHLTAQQQKSHRGENKTKSVLLQRKGHYNPYTHQYVPAPSAASNNKHSAHPVKPSSSADASEETCINLTESQGNSEAGDRDDACDNDFDDDDDFGDALNLVDDEWLIAGADDDLDDKDGNNWGMEINESELASLDEDIGSDVLDDLEDFVEESRPTTVGSLRNKLPGQNSNHSKLNPSHFNQRQLLDRNLPKSNFMPRKKQQQITKTLDSSEKSTNEATISSGTEFKRAATMPFSAGPKTSIHHKSKTGLSRSCQTNERTIQQVQKKPDDEVVSTLFPPPSKRATSNSPMSRRHSKIPSSAFLVDSPDPGLIHRKRPGESIYKAPGSHKQNAGIPKKAKKVRFHY